MLKFKELWRGKYISVISPDEYPYEAVHEPDAMIVLPVIVSNSKFVKGLTNYYLGIRREVCPPYIIKDKTNNKTYYTVISGKMDVEGESPEETMKRELIEEAGLELVKYKIIYQKKDIPLCKSTDIRVNFYCVLVYDFNKVEATGDGTKNEAESSTIFVNLENVPKILEKENVDYLLISGFYILINKIKKYVGENNE